MNILIYILISLFLYITERLYFKIADKYNIVDKPNERSSHSQITLRGGGIIFWFAALLYGILHFQESYLFLTGITLVSFISFYDDIKSLPSKIRFGIQILATTIVFLDLGLFAFLPWWFILLAYIFSVGITNAYNFMDGINGMTGLYTIAVFFSFLVVNQTIHRFCDNDFLIFPILASVVFLFFNYRKRAKCFAGDVGSISIAFWVIYILIMLIVGTGSFIWILFLAVYGIDTTLTIIHRLYLKQNIFQPHRLHYYQILCNEKKLPHRLVSAGYALTQIVISAIVIFAYGKIPTVLIFIITLIPLTILYFSKFYFLKQCNNEK